MEKDDEISKLKEMNNKEFFTFKEKFKKNIENSLNISYLKNNNEKSSKLKEGELGENKKKNLKKVNFGDIEPNMTLKSGGVNKRYNFKK